MSGTNAELSELIRILKYMQSAVSSLELARNEIKLKYQQLGFDWKDKHYTELGEVIHECNLALIQIENIMLNGQKYVASLIKQVQEYENFNWGISTNSATTSVQSSPSGMLAALDHDSSNPFCPNISLVQDRLSTQRYFSQGSHFEQYRDLWENSNNYTYSPTDSSEIVYVRARDIEGVYLSDREVENPDGFWTRNGRNGWSRSNILERASNLQTVRESLESGLTLDELAQNPDLGNTIRSYYNDPIRVASAGDFYVFQSDGRHRTLAGQAIDAYIPVLVTGRYVRNT